MLIDTLRLDSDRRLVSVILALMLFPLVGFLIRDLAMPFPDFAHLEVRFLTRAVVLSLPLIGLVFVRRTLTRQAYARLVFALTMAMAAALLLIDAQQPSGSPLPMQTTLIFLILTYAGMPNTFYRQIMAPLVLSALVVAFRMVGLPGSGEFGADLVILLFANIGGVAVVHRRRLLERQVSELISKEFLAKADAERALKQLKTLRGIIRICSYCQKVHNEEGVWQQIEAYIREHSQAEFSHGICPECVTEHFPQE